MATIWSDSNGVVLRYALTSQEVSDWGPPSNFAFSCDFDPDSNPTLTDALRLNQNSVTLPANNAPQINGVAYTIVAASQDYQTDQLIRQAIAVFKGTETLPSNAVIQNAFLAVQSGTATLLQTQICLGVTTRALGLMAQKLIAAGILG